MTGEKSAPPTADFWEKHIRAWQQSQLTQRQYCSEQKISATAFSKWKKKLHPNLKAGKKKYKTRSKYYKFTKVSDSDIELLMQCFLQGKAARTAAEASGINQNSVYKFYNDFRMAIVDGALLYPHLFYGAGMLLLLGPPPDLRRIRELFRVHFPGYTPTSKTGLVRSRTHQDAKDSPNMKTNIQVLTLVLFYNAFHVWQEEEIFVFRKWGYVLFYHYIYAPEYGLNLNAWNYEIHVKLLKEYHATTVARALWDYWANVRKHESYIKAEVWSVLYSDREVRLPSRDKEWLERMFGDFKWLLKKHRIGDKKMLRSNYWDEYAPPRKDCLETEQKLNDQL